MKLWAKIFIALGLGVIAGTVLGPQADIFAPIGTSFLKLLNMIIVPLIFASMVDGITNIPSTKELGRIGATTLGLYAVTTLIAISFGLFFATSFPLGNLLVGNIPSLETLPSASTVSLSAPITSTLSMQEILLSAIPKNPIKAFAEQNVLQIIVFAIFFGCALTLSGQKGKPVKELIEAISVTMQKLTHLIMKISPIGVFALMATAVGNMGLMLLIPVSLFLLMYYLACLTHVGVVFCGLLRGVARLPVTPFFRGVKDIFATSVSTCSSSASLPVAMECVTEKLGVSKGLANFVLPLGCSLNMNGSALFQTMAAIFIAQAYGMELSVQTLITLSLTVLFATIGTASVPGAGFMMLSIVFSSIGIPLEGLALLAGIDRLRDMGTTSLNIIGDSVCAVVVAANEGELNIETYLSNGSPALTNEAVSLKE